ncbi:hypothetical protein [Kitasatospora sp. NPDC058190]|uniref:hypothetical protein n=1 Tax=Kitasatospora sp. NPDC058190 TaxID=3346371 RepID=UPI0036D95A1F
MTARVATGERFGIARGGRLVTVPAPPALEREALERLVRDGAIVAENAATARGLADWPLPSCDSRLDSASAALHAMRDEEEERHCGRAQMRPPAERS